MPKGGMAKPAAYSTSGNDIHKSNPLLKLVRYNKYIFDSLNIFKWQQNTNIKEYYSTKGNFILYTDNIFPFWLQFYLLRTQRCKAVQSQSNVAQALAVSAEV